jgi:TPR repeat protein
MDESFAVHYYKWAADQGNAVAKFHYGLLLENGHGIPMDKSLARHSFKLAADLGDTGREPAVMARAREAQALFFVPLVLTALLGSGLL